MRHAAHLRREDLGDVALDLRAQLAALVQTVKQQQRPARHHGLAQHAVDRRGVLKAQVGVGPVPRAREGVGRGEEASLQPLHLHPQKS